MLGGLGHAGASDGNAAGTEANFACGSFVRFHLTIDDTQLAVENASFSSNGCGYMVAAAETLALNIEGRRLSMLHGLNDEDLFAAITAAIGDIGRERRDCASSVISALRFAFADFRVRQIEEFHVQTGIVCTCFGITESRIESEIEENGLQTLEQVSDACNAGMGCGSCRMLIQEMLDAR